MVWNNSFDFLCVIFIMDLRVLEKDEVDVECEVRKIDPLDESAFDKLLALVNLEIAGKRDKPILPHPLKPTTEKNVCERKIAQIREGFEKCTVTSSEQSLWVLRVRLVHVIDRLERLRRYDGDDLEVQELLEQAFKLRDRMVPVTLNRSLDGGGELEGFDQMGAAFPAPIGSRSVQGQHAKNRVDPSKNKQRSAGQLLSWNIDPSIIASGTRNGGGSSRPSTRNLFPDSLAGFVSQAETDSRRAAAQDYNFPPYVPQDAYAQAAPPVFPVHNPLPAPALGRNRVGLTHTLSKWTVRFGGGAKDLAIDEFFFQS